MSTQRYNTVLKWYNPNKGFGFLDTKDPEVGDIFIHAEVWKKAGLVSVPAPHTVVVVEAMKVGKGLRATSVVSVE